MRIEPDQPQRHPVTFHRQAEPPRRSEIERTGIARNLANHESQIAAAQPFFQREQCVLRAFYGNVDQPIPQGGRQAGLVGPPALPERAFILHPQPGPGTTLLRAIQRQGQSQPGTAAFPGRCKNFPVQGVNGPSRLPVRQAGG